MQDRKSYTGIAAELQLAFSSQEEVEYFTGAAPHGQAHDEDAELPSLETLIQAVLDSNTEDINAWELLDGVFS
jgi:hypothetical protein